MEGRCAPRRRFKWVGEKAKKLGGFFSPPFLPIGSPGRWKTLLPNRCFRNLLLVDSLYLHLSKALMFCFAHAKAAKAKFGHKCCLIKL